MPAFDVAALGHGQSGRFVVVVDVDAVDLDFQLLQYVVHELGLYRRVHQSVALGLADRNGHSALLS